MCIRLVAVLVTLMALVLTALSVPLARGIETAHQQALFLDRLDDTTRFASVAQQATAPVDQQALQTELARYDQVYGVRAVVLDETGRILLASRPDVDPSGLSTSGPAAQALAGRASTMGALLMPWHCPPMIVAVPVTRGGDVIGAAVTITPTNALRGEVLRIWSALALAALGALVLCGLLASRLAHWILRPVYTLDSATHQIRVGHLSTRAITRSGPVELRRLTTSFNEMATAVDLAMQRQRAFAADASHQLRNPLSALMLQLENLKADLEQTQADQVDEVHEEARRLARILDQLLKLATVEHTHASPMLFDAHALVAARCRAWASCARDKHIALHYHGLGPVTAWADQDLVGSALDTVIHNAVKFSPPGSDVAVSVQSSHHGAHITVRDQGPGLSPEDLARIGDRFWRSLAHQNIDGTGLGLSIARALLNITSASIDFTHTQPHGLTATLTLPTRQRPTPPPPRTLAAGPR